MATATIVSDLSTNLVTACDSLTADGSWSGVTMVLASVDPTPLEGTGRVGGIFKSITDTSNDVFFAPTASISIANGHMRWPLFSSLKSILDPSGIEMILGDGTNTAYYTVSGAIKYIGGWESLVLDVNTTPTSGTAPTMTAITTIGLIFRLTVAGKNVQTCWFDYITFGDGFQAITGGTSTSDVVALSDIDTADVYYKIFENVGGVYRARGELIFGDSAGTGTLWFADPGNIIMFDDLLVADSLYEIRVVGNATGATNADFSGIFMSSVANPWLFLAVDTDIDSCKLHGATIQNATTGVELGGATIGIGTIFDNCGLIVPVTAELDSFVVKNCAAASALLVTSSHLLTNGAFTSAGTGHAFYAATPASITISGWVYDGYAATDGVTGNEVFYNNSGGLVTLTITGGGDTPTVRNGTSATTVIVAGAVTVQVKATLKDGTPVESARVYLRASNGTGPFPFEESVTSITRAGTTATVTHTLHGMATGDSVAIAGISDNVADNGIHTITVTGVSAYTYTTADSGSTNYTGTIISTFVALSGLSLASGILSTTRVYPTNQPVVGWTRKSTSSPYLQEGVLVGEIDSVLGFNGTSVMLLDE